jgi:nucleotide-binding universal stress UspA family protein
MNLLTLRERIVGHQRHDEALPALKNMAKLLGAHRRVLLVLDRSDDLDTILPGFVARAEGATLEIVALVMLPGWSTSQLELKTTAHAKRVAGEVTSTDIRVSAEVGLGEPVATVLAAALRHDVDLIAMTVHRLGVIDRLIDHSILEEVLRQSPVPVVTIAPLPGKER